MKLMPWQDIFYLNKITVQEISSDLQNRWVLKFCTTVAYWDVHEFFGKILYNDVNYVWNKRK